jgi:hypothetical protein
VRRLLSLWFDQNVESEKAETTLRNTFCDLQIFADWLFAHGAAVSVRRLAKRLVVG